MNDSVDSEVYGVVWCGVDELADEKLSDENGILAELCSTYLPTLLV